MSDEARRLGYEGWAAALERHGEAGVLQVPALEYARLPLTRAEWPLYLEGCLEALDDAQDAAVGRISYAPEAFAAPSWPRCGCGHYDDQHDECDGSACRECMCSRYRRGVRRSRSYAARTATPVEVADRRIAASPAAQRELEAARLVLSAGGGR